MSGDRNHQAKLRDDEVCAIVALRAWGLPGRVVAKLYGVHEVHVARLRHGKRSGHARKV
jgi:hypothetical protein